MEGCETCEIVNGIKTGIHSKEYLLDMKNGWMLNHCNAPNSYLGYLILSATRNSYTNDSHVKDITDLNSNESKALGLNIRWVYSHLKKYWNNTFSDHIEQIYIAYYNETPFIKGLDLNKNLHVHLHILPRTEKMLKVCNKQLVAWDLLKIRDCFPLDYICDNGKREKLMADLKNQFKSEVVESA